MTTIEALEDENFILRMRLAEIVGDGLIIPPGFTCGERRLLGALYKRHPGAMDRDQLYAAIYWDRLGADLPDGEKIVAVMLCKLRQKLPSRDYVQTHGHVYALSDEGHAWLSGFEHKEQAA